MNVYSLANPSAFRHHANCAGRLVVFLLLMASAPRDSAAQTEHLVRIGIADSMRSEVLDEQRHFWIHLPNGGNLMAGHRYPVLYLLDGDVHLGGMAAVLEYYTYTSTPEMIVVGVSSGDHRERDLTISEVPWRNGAPVPESGGAADFARFMAEELIPHVDATYPTSDYRTLVGHSYAGLFTVYMLIHRPDLFANYIAMDPSLDWDGQLILGEMRKALGEEDFSGKGLFVSLANEIPRFSDTLTIDDVPADTTEFSLTMRSTLQFVGIVEEADSSGLRFAWKYYEHDLHGSVPLISMRDGLLFLFDWWVLRSPSLYNDPSTPTDRLVDLVRQRAERLTAHLGYPTAMEEELLTMAGFMYLETGQTEKARAFFELAVEYYPESPDALDSLVEYYLSENDPARALDYARQAARLDPSPARLERVQSLTK